MDYSPNEIKLFKKLNTPSKIQDFLVKLPFNFEEKWGTCLSPRMVLKKKKADCVEGAIFAAAVLEFHGHKPLLLDLRSVKKPYDYDHVVAIFKVDGFFGAISKTNHSVLRYREPIYKSIRELVVSYFHEYFLTNGLKSLREYSELLDLNYFNKINWRTSEKNLSQILTHLDKIKHHKILTTKQIKNLRKVDKIEIKGSWEEEYKKKYYTNGMKLKIGQLAPDFKAPDQEGKIHKLSDARGQWTLVYFYPKDDTTGCTKEACSIRDMMPNFKKLKLHIFGVSIDSEKSHKKFAEKYDLPFTLIADEDKKIVRAYGVWGKKKMYGREYMGTLRTSFLIDPKGKIVKIYEKVNPEVHADELLEDLKNLQ